MNKSELDTAVEVKEAALRGLSVEDIGQLPEHKTEEMTVLGKKGKLTVYHRALGGKHTVVIQGSLERWWGITAKVAVRGFELAGNTRRTLEAEELYDYT